MAKNKNLIKNTSYNFKLRKTSSILIGFLILLATFLIKTIIKGFITDGSPFAFLTVNFLEYFIFLITFLMFFFSSLFLFFGNRKIARKNGFSVWNPASKKQFLSFVLLILLMYCLEFFLLYTGREQLIIPLFLTIYGFLFILLNFSKIKILYYFSLYCFLLGFLAFSIESVETASLYLLGISQIILSFFLKK